MDILRGPEGSRALLATVAGSMMTIASVTFSITIVALQLASSQFGPRLLRNFMRDRGNQIAIGTFIATFTYCLLILRTVNGMENEQFVPHISVTLALLLALMSVGVWIYFIHHSAESIQAENVIAAVSRDLHEAIDRLYPQCVGQEPPESSQDSDEMRLPDGFDESARCITTERSDYLQAIDVELLLRLANERDLVISVGQRPGKFHFSGDNLARAWPADRVDDELADKIRGGFYFGPRRTLVQDVEFAIDQLVEVAVRALSPGVNDPFTAINCVDRLGAALCSLSKRTIPSSYRYDEEGQLRVVIDASTIPGIVDACFDQVRQAARGNTSVTLRLLETIAAVARHTRDETFLDALRRQADAIHRGSQEGIKDPSDREDTQRRYRQALEAICDPTRRGPERAVAAMTAGFVFALTLLVAVLISELAESQHPLDRGAVSAGGHRRGRGVFRGSFAAARRPARRDPRRAGAFQHLVQRRNASGDKGFEVRLASARSRSFLRLAADVGGDGHHRPLDHGPVVGRVVLIGAVLSPTDPVFAAAIVGREEVPRRLRQLLNVESGLNDGLALPMVVAMLAVVDSESFSFWEVSAEVLGGIGIGILVPWAAIRLEQSRFFMAHGTYQPLNAFAIGLLVLTISWMTGANAFLAAFAAGITVATAGPEVRQAFQQFGELVAELLKLAALLVFGALISPRFLAEIPLSGYFFALLTLIAVRPIALSLSLIRSQLGWRERVAAAWFGPKGFASVVFGLLILKESHAGRMDLERADHLFHLVAICIAGSIIAHSSTDVLVARWLARGKQEHVRRQHDVTSPTTNQSTKYARLESGLQPTD